ncbi:hypothetical protein TESG_08343 [Trichophyton tonsurans CBS 112818]|uniref:Uncharacterized protein n=1 Tax=Trichophyton tonsurans (strain CBS 112818) TaxID=647933 RepID=F2RTS3_TRIT1|nr:hypothetical protein TESG_08343 [Trichophyton tonsurans CBS 112818]
MEDENRRLATSTRHRPSPSSNHSVTVTVTVTTQASKQARSDRGMENEIEMEDASGPPSLHLYGLGDESQILRARAGTKTSSVLQEETSRRRGA